MNVCHKWILKNLLYDYTDQLAFLPPPRLLHGHNFNSTPQDYIHIMCRRQLSPHPKASAHGVIILFCISMYLGCPKIIIFQPLAFERLGGMNESAKIFKKTSWTEDYNARLPVYCSASLLLCSDSKQLLSAVVLLLNLQIRTPSHTTSVIGME